MLEILSSSGSGVCVYVWLSGCSYVGSLQLRVSE